MSDVEIETRRWVLCFDCKGRIGTIDHLAGETMRRVGPWYCKDGCGVGWSFETDGRSVQNAERSSSGRWMPATVTLVLPPQSKHVAFTLNTHTFEPIEEGCEYFYNEHTCPTNWMRDVVKIQIGDDTDPHGLFEFTSIAAGHIDDR